MPSPDTEKEDRSPDESQLPQKLTRVRRMRACKQCHSLKVRCTPVDENDPYSPCVRCTNFNKTCEIDLDQPRKRRKRANKRDSESVAELHDQIADLQEQLRQLKRQAQIAQDLSQSPAHAAQSAQNGHTPAYSVHPSAQNLARSLESGSPPFISKVDLEREMSYLCEENITLNEILDDIRTCADRRKELLRKNDVVDVVSMGIISLDSARVRLDLYRNELYAAHPLVEIPEKVTVEDFIKDEPFLFNTIMAISTMVSQSDHDRDTNLAIENHAIERVVSEIMVAGLKTVELLKSLILLSLWYNSPEFFKLRRYHILNCVAVTLLHDLGIVNRSSYSYSSDTKSIQKIEDDNSSLEYRSLILILYFSTVSFCLILRRAIYVKWTPYVNECCDTLEKVGGEKYRKLAIFLRLNHELERIHHIVHAPEANESNPKLSKYALAEFQTNLAIIKSNIKPDDHQTRAYYYSVEAYLHQPKFNDIQISTSSPTGCTQKLDSETLSAIAHCTASCLFALDEFNQLLPNEIAGLPLFYSSRVIYTAGMLMRLRYFILSLPSQIEKELVPQYAIVTIAKLNSRVGVASKMFSGNNFLKKMRLILLLFIQTYVTQVMELLKQNDDSTPNNFKPLPLSRSSRNDLVQVASALCKQGDSGSLITDHGLPYPPALHLDLLSFAAAAFQNGGDDKDKEGDTASETPIKKDASNDAEGVPRQIAPVDGRRTLDVRNSAGQFNQYNVTNNYGPDMPGQPMRGNISHNVASLKLYAFPTLPVPNAGNPYPGTAVVGDQYNNMPPPQNNLGLVSPLPEIEFPSTLNNSFFNIDDEFWSNLLSTDSNKFHFAQDAPVSNGSVLYMN